MNSFTQFLNNHGISQATVSPEKLVTLKKEYRALYQKEWQKNTAKTTKRIQVTFTLEEFKTIKEAAKQHGVPITPFIKKCAFAYLNQVFINPASDKKIQQKLRLGLLKIGTVTNQQAYLSNRRGWAVSAEIAEMLKQYRKLDELMSSAFEYPQNLNRLIEEAVFQHPDCKDSLLQSILNSKSNAD